MPHMQRLLASSAWGAMRSTNPPITVPAWASMMSGRDPGELGLYGFRQRVRGSYDLRLVNAEDFAAPCVWDWLGQHSRKSSVLFVPPSFPAQPLVGERVSCFLTPDTEQTYTYPSALQTELTKHFGAYQMDVEEYRTEDKSSLLKQLYAMTEQHFAMARHLWQTRRPDLLAMVEIGPDRLHHAFWQHMDPTHPQYSADSKYNHVGPEYYAFLDAQIGAFLALTNDETAVFVVSDHGAQPLLGGANINEWLIHQGWLVLREPARGVQPLSPTAIDWEKTKAWAEGGYYSRVFLNVTGREPQGTIDPSQILQTRAELAALLERFPHPHGKILPTEVCTPESLYRSIQGFAPDLMVFFDDLRWRAIGSVGHGTFHSPTNDQGPDACNHAWNGVFAMGAAGAAGGEIFGVDILDVAPSVLGALGCAIPQELRGNDWSQR